VHFPLASRKVKSAFWTSFELEQIGTKGFVEVLKRFGLSNVLIVLDGDNPNVELSARNVPYVKVMKAEGVNVYDVMKHQQPGAHRRCRSPAGRSVSVMKPLHQIIKKPLVTEKPTLQEEGLQVVAFEVAIDANKIEIKQAVEKAFEVKVDNVNTMLVAGKVKRVGRNFGKRSNWKKAYVTLAEGSKLDLFGV
jgi:large subunit ribosomal protein L23